MSTITITETRPYALAPEQAISDLWWPYGPTAGRYSIKAAGEQTGGRLVQLVITESRGAGTPLHVHRDTDETFLVLSGSLTVLVGDERHDVGPGGYVFAPMGIAHAFAVTSDEAEFLVTFSPAGTEGPAGHGAVGFFREVAVPVIEGEAPPAPAVPDAQLFASRMAVYGIDLVGPPPALG